MLNSICVYCGSRRGSDTAHVEAAIALGRALAQQGTTLVYGGGHVGLMGLLADAALADGGRVIGVIPEQLQQKEVAHSGLSQLHVVADMHERKAMMAQLAEAFIAMPGGLGTLEELAEMLTWQQLGIHTKPIGLLNSGGYYDRLLDFIDHAVENGFVRPEDRRSLCVAETPEPLLRKLNNHTLVTQGHEQ